MNILRYGVNKMTCCCRVRICRSWRRPTSWRWPCIASRTWDNDRLQVSSAYAIA